MVLTLPEALAQPHIASQGVVKRLKAVPGLARDIDVFTSGFKLSGGAPQVTEPPPLLGAHTDAVMADLGYTAQEVAAFREAGAI